MRWTTPRAALDADARGELVLAFPTLKQLEDLAGSRDRRRAVWRTRFRREVQPIMPRVVLAGDTSRIVLPGEPGYDDE